MSHRGHGSLVAVSAWANTLHAAAASAGITIPKARSMGCCRVKVLAGQTEMAHDGGITDEEIAEGYALSCGTMASFDGSVES